MLADRKLILAAAVGLLAAALFLFPVSFFTKNLNSERVQLDIYRGNLLGGNANLFYRPSAESTTEFFLLSWDLCTSGSFPFFSFCWNLKGDGREHSGKLVGLPGDTIVLDKITSSLPVERLTEVVGSSASPALLAILRLRGVLDISFDKLVIDTATSLPAKWDGRMELNSAGFFNLDLPNIVFLFSVDPFISNTETAGAQNLPTVRLQGADETMDIAGNIQLLPDRQVKISIEILARDNLALQTFAPLATNREGNRLFITYQGALPGGAAEPTDAPPETPTESQ